ncbi:MAG TPA: DNA repair protein RecN [Rhodocyclaceae bacterium]|nr:DNA repair protein RecN [Rhodocyclaceae bacterium]
MLLRLTIRDFVLVDRLELEFAAGFGTLTGETGAGKSILIDALSFVLGERADSGVIREGCDKAEVSAEFDLAGLPLVRELLQKSEIDAAGDQHDELILRRVVDAGGRSRALINGTPVTLLQLREITDLLIDIHGQHAHQSLLKGDAQRAMVDNYGGHGTLVGKVGTLWRAWQEIEGRYRQALAGGEQLAREREALQWEVDELEKLAFLPDEWETLNAEQARLAHAASLIDGAQAALQDLGEGDAACLSALSHTVAKIDGLVSYDERLQPVLELLRAAEADVGEAVTALRRYSDRIDLDPARLAEVDRRMDAVLSLARKFRIQPDGLPEALATRRQRLAELAEGADPEALRQLADAAKVRYLTDAEALSKVRRSTARKLSTLVSEKMNELSLGGGQFEVALLPEKDGAAYGLEKIEFRIAALAGNESRPLAKVASGGELSRISLALQVVASKSSDVPTLIFDEVDVGIGGGVAEVVGRLLNALGKDRQVLCVTHLPQVAARADWQWRVRKTKVGNRFASEVAALDHPARVEEIARMLGGVEITPVTRQHASEMLAAS